MSTQDASRELMAKRRQEREHIQETMLERTAAELNKANLDLEAASRELVAKARQDQEHTQETMRSRSVQDLD